MFAKLVQATWGDDTGEATNTDDSDSQVASASASKDSSDKPAQGTATSTAIPNFWGVAASLADTVKKNTAEITAGLKETNWRAELEAFGKGVREEEQVLRQETAKRVEVAKEHFPKDATAQLEQKRKELAVHLQKMGVGLGSLSKRVATRTTDLFDQVKESLVEELSAKDRSKAAGRRQPGKVGKGSSKYSRLEADISTMQRDSATYCEEPTDNADYQAWRAQFDMASYKPAVEALTQENAFMAELQARIVPIIVEYDAFWTRYFYQLHLLEARHAQLIELARRASKPQEEEVSWDDADDQPEATHSPRPAQRSPAADQSHHAKPQPEQSEQSSESRQPQKPSLKSLQQKQQQPSAVASDAAPASEAAGSDVAEDAEQDVTAAAADEDAPDAVTSSDSGSATEHWTVVTSPSKQADSKAAPFGQGGKLAAVQDAAEPREQVQDAQRGLPSSETAGASATAAASATEVADDNDVDDLDDVANDDSPGSEGDEDWGSWE